MDESILDYFPEKYLSILKINSLDNLEEIRLRANKPLILKFTEEERIINYNVTQEEILEMLQKFCDNSIYSYQKQISQGYITIKRRT